MTAHALHATSLRGHRVLLVGPGWLGQAVAEHMVSLGSTVGVLQRSARPSLAQVAAIAGDITHAAAGAASRDALCAAVAHALPLPIDHLVVCVAPSRARGDDYSLYPRAAAGVAALARALGIRSVLYVSSTGVYDRHDGSEVTEQSPITPHDARVQALHDAEQLLLQLADDQDTTVHIVRAAGLYGPQRDPIARFTDPAFAAANVWCNFSWRDDVVSAITHLLTHDRAPGARFFNCADGTPLRSSDIAATLTGRTTPTPEDRAPIDRSAPVRSGRSNQRINVDALLATGWRPAAPTVYDGLRLLGHSVPLAAVAS